jgi:hypothetical protein
MNSQSGRKRDAGNCIAPASRPASYFPPSRGVYDVGPGLHVFGTDFGNGDADRRLFQIDTEYCRYRAAKLAARAERLGKYYRIDRYSVGVNEAVARLIIRHLTLDYPQWYQWHDGTEGGTLRCALSRETLHFHPDMTLAGVEYPSEVAPLYASALDALASQIQEDVAVVSRDTDGTHRVSALHVCFPNYWSPEQKIGRRFGDVHAPVAGMDKTNARDDAMVDAMIRRDPYTRFTWGLTTDTRLNHHPVPPHDVDADKWIGRRFEPAHPELYFRVERQVSWGLPQVDAALFTIRTLIRSATVIRNDPMQREKLAAALRSMTDEQTRYKGLAVSREEIIRWLTSA